MKQETDIAAETFKRIDSVGEAMKQLAVELKVPAGELFHALCVRERVEGIFVACVGLLIFLAVWVVNRWLDRRVQSGDTEDGDAVFARMPLFILSVPLGLALIGCNLHRIVVPEVAAIEAIVEMAK